MHKQDEEKEYNNRRKEDNRKNKIVEKFVDEIYKENGIKIIRIEDDYLQKCGVDLVHICGAGQRCVDEKFAVNYRMKNLTTFAFELYAKNNVHNAGCFVSDHMITEYYVLLWFRSDEEITELQSYDLCYIKKEKIKEYLKTVGYYDGIVQDFIKYWESYPDVEMDKRFIKKDNHQYMELQDGVRIVRSLQFKKEMPINVVIPKKTLLELAEFCIHK